MAAHHQTCGPDVGPGVRSRTETTVKILLEGFLQRGQAHKGPFSYPKDGKSWQKMVKHTKRRAKVSRDEESRQKNYEKRQKQKTKDGKKHSEDKRIDMLACRPTEAYTK